MQVTWWMPGTFAGIVLPCSSPPILVRWPRAFARLLLDPGPDLRGQRIPSLLLEVGHKTDRAGHHGQAATDLPGQAELARNCADGTGGVDRQRTLIGDGRLLSDQLHQAHIVAGEAVFCSHLEKPGYP